MKIGYDIACYRSVFILSSKERLASRPRQPQAVPVFSLLEMEDRTETTLGLNANAATVIVDREPLTIDSDSLFQTAYFSNQQ
jgi:hypothetical protein